MNRAWTSWRDAFAAGDAVAVGFAALLVGAAAFAAVRLLSRARPLRLLMLVGFWGGLATLLVLAALSLSFYRPEAWLPLGGELGLLVARSPLAWLVAAAVIGAGLALRAPRPRLPVIAIEPAE